MEALRDGINEPHVKAAQPTQAVPVADRTAPNRTAAADLNATFCSSDAMRFLPRTHQALPCTEAEGPFGTHIPEFHFPAGGKPYSQFHSQCPGERVLVLCYLKYFFFLISIAPFPKGFVRLNLPLSGCTFDKNLEEMNSLYLVWEDRFCFP